jgi:hypothetical protein
MPMHQERPRPQGGQDLTEHEKRQTIITLSPAHGGIFDLVLSHQGRGNPLFPPSM